MASKNFCDICGALAIQPPEPQSTSANELNRDREKYDPFFEVHACVKFDKRARQQNMNSVVVSDCDICAACSIKLLQQHIEKLSVTPK